MEINKTHPDMVHRTSKPPSSSRKAQDDFFPGLLRLVKDGRLLKSRSPESHFSAVQSAKCCTKVLRQPPLKANCLPRHLALGHGLCCGTVRQVILSRSCSSRQAIWFSRWMLADTCKALPRRPPFQEGSQIASIPSLPRARKKM